MSDLLHQNFATVQSNEQPGPPTIASAATIAPANFLTFVTGTTAVGTITPPISGQHMLILIFTDASPGTMLTTGNIRTATGSYGTDQYGPCFMFYDPGSRYYYAKNWINI